MGRDDVLSPRQVEGMIADGGVIVIYEDVVLKLDSWLAKHPGGKLAIQHMVGRDATDEMSISHSAETLRTMKAFRIGRKPAGLWPSMVPPIRGGVYRKLGVEGDKPDACPDIQMDNGYLSDPDSDRSESILTESDLLTPILTRDSAPSSVTSVSDCDDVDVSSEKASEAGLGLRRRMGDAVGKKDIYRKLSPNEYTDWAMHAEIDRDLHGYPSLEPEVQAGIQRKYQAMHQKIIDMGLYDCPYLEYAKECTRYITLFSLFIFLLRAEWHITAGVFLGLFWHQLMFTAHDAGHRAITHIFWVDTLIGLFIADFCCGLSIGWWKSSHNVHHLVTNQPEHDPDIQNVPLFATCPSFFKSLRSTYYNFVFVWDKAAEVLVPYQKYTYYPIMGIARFNLYLLSWIHVLSSRSTGLGSTKAWWIRPMEMAAMGGYWYLFGYRLLLCYLPDWWTRFAFVMVSHVFMAPLHVQITLSHWGMSTSTLGESESFAQRQLRTTMDVDCPAWIDFIHGGLQFQAVHHLFPRVPRHNLRKAQALVREFCAETGIPYSILTFVDGNKKVMGRLDEVGEQVKMLVNCQKYMAETGESGLH